MAGAGGLRGDVRGGGQGEPGDELPHQPRRPARAGPDVYASTRTRRSSSTTSAASAPTAPFARPTSRPCASMAKHKRVMVKVGAFYALGQEEAAVHRPRAARSKSVVKAFGAKRCMWESDCPFQVGPGTRTRTASISSCKRLDFLTADDRDWLLARRPRSSSSRRSEGGGHTLVRPGQPARPRRGRRSGGSRGRRSGRSASSWSRPSRCRIVACRSWMWTLFSTA